MALRTPTTPRDAIRRILSIAAGKPQAILRSTSASGTTDYVGTRPMSSITFDADAGTATVVTDGGTLMIAGGTNISTAVTPDTITINNDMAAGMQHWHLGADSGSAEQVDDNETVTISGTNGIDTVVSATNTVTAKLNGNVPYVGIYNANASVTTDHTILCNAAGAMTLTLCAADAGNVGRQLMIRNAGGGTVTIAAAGIDTIEGSASIALAAGYGTTLTCVAEGSWYTFI